MDGIQVPANFTASNDSGRLAGHTHFREHPMNMVITELHFFLDEPGVDQTFLLDEVRLVP